MSKDLMVDLQQRWERGPERCGVVLASGEIVELTNQSDQPSLSFSVSDAELEPYLDQVVASWHTHPQTSGNLSVSDYRTFQNYPQWHHYIIDRTSVWAYSVALDGMVLLDQIIDQFEETTHE